ncbi:MAG: DNA mismatch endonuclease Vsr [Desulfosarcina sp.]|nr:DNA mismatch endonuclease Vsr [Desulfosarcina sp.]
MADRMTKSQRSYTMSRIKSKGNQSTELKTVAIFKEYGIKGWRRNQKVEGNPDFIFRQQKVAIFIDGCFWHGCPKCYIPPKSNIAYWETKIARNRKRDRTITKVLTGKNWTVLRFWEHSLMRPKYVANKVLHALSAIEPIDKN